MTLFQPYLCLNELRDPRIKTIQVYVKYNEMISLIECSESCFANRLVKLMERFGANRLCDIDRPFPVVQLRYSMENFESSLNLLAAFSDYLPREAIKNIVDNYHHEFGIVHQYRKILTGDIENMMLCPKILFQYMVDNFIFSLPVVTLLLPHANIELKNRCLLETASMGYYDIVKLLLKETGLNKCDPLLAAARKGHISIIELFLRDEDVKPGMKALAAAFASKPGHYDVIKLILSDKEIDPSFGTNWILREAVDNNHYKIVKLLMKDERVKSDEFIPKAKESRNEKMLRYLTYRF